MADIWMTAHAERQVLAAGLVLWLTIDQWATQSLCGG